MGFYGLGFLKFHLEDNQGIVYAILGFILFLANGLFAGLLLTVWQIKSDLKGIIAYSFEIMKSCIDDLNQVRDVLKKERKDILNLLFKGLIHIVTLPTLIEIIKKKIPIIGFFFGKIMKFILTMVSNKVEFDEQVVQNTEEKKVQANKAAIYVKSITSMADDFGGVINFIFKIVQGFIAIISLFLLVFLMLFLIVI